MNVVIEKSVLEDGKLFKQLLLQPDVLEYFPMWDIKEIDDSIVIWEFFCKKGASLTAHVDGKECGLAYLNLQTYKKLAHQCIITIVVDKEYRNRGIGTRLLQSLFVLGRKAFNLEMLHLEVYENNPAINLYKRLGFKEFGKQPKFIKEKNGYIGKILMERSLI